MPGDLDPTFLTNYLRIKELRIQKRHSQESLAVKIDKSKKAIENAEKKGCRTRESILRLIAEEFGVRIEELIAPIPNKFAFSPEMLEAIPVPIFIKDSDEIYRECNNAFCEFLGRTRDEIIGQPVINVALKTDAMIYKSKDKELLENPGVQQYSTHVESAKGRRHVMFYKGTFPADGSPSGIIGAIFDITDLPLLKT